MNRRDLLVLSGALAATTLAGCGGRGRDPVATESPTDTREKTPTDTPADSTSDTPTNTPASGTPAVDDERLAELASGNGAFALDLHEHLAAEQGGNLFLSPYSISVALTMTYAGARGETETQMCEALRYTLGEDVHPAFSDLGAALEARSTTTDPVEDEEVEAFQLNLANELWGREDYAFADEYLDLVEEHYSAGLRRADFVGDPEGERERINQWVASETEDRIDDLLSPNSLDSSTVLVLTNAIYFVASWYQEFDPEDTEDGTFTGLDGSGATVPMMRQELRTDYASLSGGEAIELPYVGRDVSMVLILPEEGEFRSFEGELDADRLFGIFDALGDASGDVTLPRFEFETSVQLSGALSALGMPVAFGSGADFGGMTDGGNDLWIDEVFHDSFVSVDEEGTEAAAATAVVTEVSAPSQTFDLTFDRPFLFCIRDRPTGAVLFLGRVVDLSG